MQVANVCVDASVAVKWFIGDEAGSAAALHLLYQFGAGQIRMVVPSLFHYEVANALHVAQRRGRVSLAAMLKSTAALESINLAVVPVSGILGSCVAIAQRYGIAVYDAAYIATAEAESATLVSCDKKVLAIAKHGSIAIVPLPPE